MVTEQDTERWGKLRGQLSDGIVLDEWEAIYVPIPKVACTSLSTLFARMISTKGDIPYVFEVPFKRVANRVIRKDYADYYVFAFVRNPWDRLLSCFLSKIDPTEDDDGTFYRNGVEFNFWKYGDMFHSQMSFSDFVRATTSIPDEEADIHFSSQYRHLTDRHRNLVPDFIGRFESLAGDLEELRSRMHMPKTAPPHKMKTEHKHYSHYYTEETRALVEGRYPEDIELFGYRCEEKS